MLILMRKMGQQVFIECPDGSKIVVTVGQTSPDGSVSLGFDAPRSIQIVRDDAKRRSDRSSNPYKQPPRGHGANSH